MDDKDRKKAHTPVGMYVLSVVCAIFALLALYAGFQTALEGEVVDGIITAVLGFLMFAFFSWGAWRQTETVQEYRSWLRTNHVIWYSLGVGIRILGIAFVILVVLLDAWLLVTNQNPSLVTNPNAVAGVDNLLYGAGALLALFSVYSVGGSWFMAALTSFWRD